MLLFHNQILLLYERFFIRLPLSCLPCAAEPTNFARNNGVVLSWRSKCSILQAHVPSRLSMCKVLRSASSVIVVGVLWSSGSVGRTGSGMRSSGIRSSGKRSHDGVATPTSFLATSVMAGFGIGFFVELFLLSCVLSAFGCSTL